MVNAMRSREELRLSTLRMVKSSLKNKEIEKRGPLDEKESLAVLSTLIKQRKDSIEQFTKGNRLELAKKEAEEIVIIEGYMPQAVSDRRWVSFMYSYPNLVPLPASEIRRIAAALAPHRFDRLYSSWVDRVVPTDAHAAVQRSASRYVEKIAG